MYPPDHYTDNSPEFLARVLREHSFGVLTTAGRGGQCATHLPILFDPDEGENGALYGHIAAINPQVKHLNGHSHGMVVFSGPHAYISPTWIAPSPKSVPTWNYTAVHVWGRPIELTPAQSSGLMARLNAQYEGQAGWDMTQMDADYAKVLLEKHIIWFKMDIEKISGLRKMSQNKSAEVREQIITGLKAAGELAAADEVQKTLK